MTIEFVHALEVKAEIADDRVMEVLDAGDVDNARLIALVVSARANLDGVSSLTSGV